MLDVLRVKINGSHTEGSEQMLADVEVLTEPGIYSAVQVLHLGLVRSDDPPKVLSIGIINSAHKPITIQVNNFLSFPLQTHSTW